MDIDKYTKEKIDIPKPCWNIKSINNKDSSINSVIVPTTDDRQNSADFPSLKEASSKLNKMKASKNSKIAPPLLKKQSRKSISGDIQVLQINNLKIDYQEYCSPVKKEFKFNKIFSENDKKNNEKRDDNLNKVLVPYSPYANYHSMFMPPPYSSLYHYWWKIPKYGFDLINNNNSNDQSEQLKQLVNLINDKDISSNSNYSEQELQNMMNILKTLNIKIGDMTQNNYDATLYATSSTISKIKIKDINPPNSKNHGKF